MPRGLFAAIVLYYLYIWYTTLQLPELYAYFYRLAENDWAFYKSSYNQF